MKNVAGFHSLDLGLETLDVVRLFFRRGLGIRLAQKEGWVMPWMLEYGRGVEW